MKNDDNTATLLRTINFAAIKHRGQKRKNLTSPYINHPIAVAELLSRYGVNDTATLQGAILHDTIEDTQTTPAEIEELFGTEVKTIVLEVSDDKNLPLAERKRLQIEHAPHLSEKAKLIKIADKINNVYEIIYAPPKEWEIERRLGYLEWAQKVVDGCRGSNDQLDKHFDDLIKIGEEILEKEKTTN